MAMENNELRRRGLPAPKQPTIALTRARTGERETARRKMATRQETPLWVPKRRDDISNPHKTPPIRHCDGRELPGPCSRRPPLSSCLVEPLHMCFMRGMLTLPPFPSRNRARDGIRHHHRRKDDDTVHHRLYPLRQWQPNQYTTNAAAGPAMHLRYLSE
ncbi:hypothetical protein BDZ97DRAFT_1789369 [Flammula alnicola]|nr:hypothetical protein BDZ97DRAFT_1789369 [Flammula alnicola]